MKDEEWKANEWLIPSELTEQEKQKDKGYSIIKEWSHVGLACMIIKASMGHLCGYVGLQSGHPWFMKDDNQCLLGCEKVPHKPTPLKDTIEEIEQAIKWTDMMNRLNGGHWPCTWNESHRTIQELITVHGGVTFSGEYPDEGGLAKDGGIWWIGFDCAHSQDYVPELGKFELEYFPDHLLSRNQTYKGEDYVLKEVEHMAEQIKEYYQE